MRSLFLFLALAASASAASPLIVGGRGGAGLTANNGYITSALGLSSHSYVIGPTAGVRLPLGFSVEGDALFNRQTLSIPQIGLFNGLGTHADSWEFPVMLKFTPGRSAVAPVLGAGVSFRHINNFGSIPSYLLAGDATQTATGLVAGGGIRFKAGPADITPEIRYTRWNGGGLAQSLLNALTASRNQAQVLVGITF